MLRIDHPRSSVDHAFYHSSTTPTLPITATLFLQSPSSSSSSSPSSSCQLTMADVDLPADLAAFDYDPRGIRYSNYASRGVSWPIPLPLDHNAASRSAPHHHHVNNATHNTMKRSTTPIQSQPYQQPIDPQSQFQTQATGFLPDWPIPQQSAAHLGYPLPASYGRDAAFSQSFAEYNSIPFQTSPTDYLASQTQYDSNLPLDASYIPLASQVDNSMTFNYQDFPDNLLGYPVPNGLPDMNVPPLQNLPNSPTDTALEVRSLSSSDNGWTSVDYQHASLDGSFQDAQMGAIFNPEQTLHGRTFSDSSYSDVERQSQHSWGSYVDVAQHPIGSPSSDPGDSSSPDFHSPHLSNQSSSPVIKQEEQPTRPMIVTSSTVKPLRIKTSSSPHTSPTSTGRVSPPGRRQSKKTNPKATKSTIRRPSQITKVETEKKLGRRKGPLRPEQRKQASEIRKLGACIRCKFLKKTVSKAADLTRPRSSSVSSVIKASLAKGVARRTPASGKFLARESISRRLRIS